VIGQDVALKNFFEGADPALVLASLQNSEYDSKYHKMAAACSDPKQAQKSMARIAREHGVSLVDLVEKYREITVLLAHLENQERLSEVVKENVVDALPAMRLCPVCQGAKRVEDPQGRLNKAGNVKRVKCLECLGKGRVRVGGATDAKKLVMQTAGLIETGGGTKVQVNVGTGVPDLMQVIDAQERALKVGRARGEIESGQVVEGEVIDG
jgi:hypothetical protein